MCAWYLVNRSTRAILDGPFDVAGQALAIQDRTAYADNPTVKDAKVLYGFNEDGFFAETSD